MRNGVVALVVLAAAAGLTPHAAAFEEVFQQSYPLASGGSFRLQNVNGSISVSGWERDTVEVRAVKTARRNAADLERVRIEVEATRGAVSVETRYPQGEGVDVSVEYRVRVPHRVLLSFVGTVNGSVTVAEIEGAGELRSVNGNVEALDCAGRLSASTTNGNIRLELRRLDPAGPISAETVNGSVAIALPADAGAELDARSLNGDFRSELPLVVRGSFGAREILGRLGAGGPRLTIRTMNGAIRIATLRPTI